MVIFGWLRRAIVLGGKTDLCPSCRTVGPHGILRVTSWVHVFWVPIMPIWISHQLACGECGASRKLGWRQVRAALKAGRLPLERRPEFKEYGQQVFEATGRMPQEAEFDPVEKNPRRGPWDLYLKAWPIIVIALVVAIAVWPQSKPAPARPLPTAHTCWVDADGAINGCRLDDGSMDGDAIGDQVKCFFVEPMPTGDADIRCVD